MLSKPVGPVSETLPRGEIRGAVLVVSDNRLLNLSHAVAVCSAGYAVYTAVTCTDLARVFKEYSVEHIDLIVFASLVHGWHHQEAEERPREMPPFTDAEWQIRNILQVVDIVSSRQQTPPKVIVAADLISHDCYSISKDALEAAGISVEMYSAGNPPSIVRFLQ
jgi:hypothetical protein